MKNGLRIAIFGVGGYGANHLAVIEQLQSEGLMELVAVADPAVKPLSEVKARLENRGVRWFTGYQELLSSIGDQLDAVSIAAPIPLHLPMLNAALDYKLAVYLEKPPVPLLQDFLAVNARPEATRVAVGFQRMADPRLWRLKRAIVDGALGSIRRISSGGCWPRLNSYYERSGWAGKMWWNGMPVFDGPATNALAHIVHDMMYLAGKTFEGFSVPTELYGELYRARQMESYDLCCFKGKWSETLEFTGAFTHATERKDPWVISVHGDKGEAILKDDANLESSVPLSGEDGELLDGNGLRSAAWRNFHSFLTGQIKKPFTTLEDCRGYVATTNAMLVSSGEIQSLPASTFRSFERDGDPGLHIEGINELISKSQSMGRLFSEMGVAWAKSGTRVDVASLREVTFPGKKS